MLLEAPLLVLAPVLLLWWKAAPPPPAVVAHSLVAGAGEVASPSPHASESGLLPWRLPLGSTLPGVLGAIAAEA
jgi:hypothetical protein